MKKNKIISISCITLLIIVLIGIFYYMNQPIVSMSRSMFDEAQVANGCGFTLDNAKEIVVKYDSTVGVGNLVIRLTDENWNTIKEFQTDISGNEKIKLENGKYYIRVESDYFKGSYHVKVYD